MRTRRIVLSLVAVAALVLSSANVAEACHFGGCRGGGCFGGFFRNLFHHNCCSGVNDCGCQPSCDNGCGCQSNGCGGGCGCGGATESKGEGNDAAPPAAPEKSA